jgi:hypothetical protein
MLLLLVLVQTVVYRVSLAPAARLLEDRKEALIEAAGAPA